MRIIITLLAILFQFQCKQTKKIIFSGGFKGGTYFKIGEGLKKLSGYNVTVLSTNGSLDNILLVSNKKADYSLTQLDMLQNYSIGTPEIKDKVKIIIPLYGEEVHLLARKEILEIKDLVGKRISIGPSSSGTKISSLIFLNQIGLDDNQITIEEIEQEKAVPMLLKKELDALILIAGKPVKILSDIPAYERANIHLIEFPAKLYQTVQGTNLTYQNTDILQDVYKWQDRSVKTIVVQSVLIGRADLTNDEVKEFVNMIFKNKDLLSRTHPKWGFINNSRIKELYKNNPEIFHPAIKDIIAEIDR